MGVLPIIYSLQTGRIVISAPKPSVSNPYVQIILWTSVAYCCVSYLCIRTYVRKYPFGRWRDLVHLALDSDKRRFRYDKGSYNKSRSYKSYIKHICIMWVGVETSYPTNYLGYQKCGSFYFSKEGEQYGTRRYSGDRGGWNPELLLILLVDELLIVWTINT